MARGRVSWAVLETPPPLTIYPTSVVHARAFGTATLHQGIRFGAINTGLKPGIGLAFPNVVATADWTFSGAGANYLALWDDDSRSAQTSLASLQSSDFLHVFTFGFIITGTVVGVEVELVLQTTPTGPDISATLQQGAGGPGTPMGTPKLLLAPASGTYVLGGPTDLWGLSSLSEATVEQAGFGVRLHALNDVDPSVVNIDRVRLRVYYETAPVVHARAFGNPMLSSQQGIVTTSVVHNRAIPNIHAVLPQPILVSPASVEHERAFGNPLIAINIKPIGLVHERAFGNPTLQQGAVAVAPSSTVHARAFGTAVVANAGARGRVSWAVFEIPPSPAGEQIVSTTSVEHERAFGNPTVVHEAVVVSPPSVVRTREIGIPIVARQPRIAAAGFVWLFGDVDAGEIVPTPTIHNRAFGVPRLSFTMRPPSVVRTRAFGNPVLGGFIVPQSVVHPRAIGTPLLSNIVAPPSTLHSREFGTAAVGKASVTITVPSIVRTRAFGSATVASNSFPQTITPPSVIHTRNITGPTIIAAGATPALVQARFGMGFEIETFEEDTSPVEAS